MKGVSALALFCEDIRRESTGKETLIGVMSDVLRVNLPGKIRRLVVYYRMKFETGVEYDQAIMPSLEWNGEALDSPAPHEPLPISLLQGGILRAEERKLPYFSVAARINLNEPVPVEEPGQILAFLNIGSERLLCGALTIIAKPSSSTASEPPSSQSPPGALAS